MEKEKLTVKDMDISTGSTYVGILNEKDAEKYDLHPEDRIKVLKGRKEQVVVVDIAESEKAVPRGKIGLFEEVLDALNLKNGDKVKVTLAGKPKSLVYIKKKLDGKELTKEEIEQIVWDIVHNRLDDIELTHFISACYSNVLSSKETVYLTKAMAESGEMLEFGGKVLDKHCTGGVAGNRTTMVIVPIIAAAGYKIPKTSSRSITSPAGTADTMEVLARVDFPLKKLKKIVKKVNGCMVWGGALNLAPADDKIIKVERPLRIDAESQLLASIMAKKASVGASHVLIDIPIGIETKISEKRAKRLRRRFKKIGKELGMKVKVITTSGNEPIGNGIGPALEARDILKIMRRDEDRPLDLEEKGLKMAGLLLNMAGRKDGKEKARKILESGKAYEKLKEIIKAQKGNPEVRPEDIEVGQFIYELKAKKKGILENLENDKISKVARLAGAPKDKGAGIYLHKHEGDKVQKGEKIMTVYAESRTKLKFATDFMKENKVYEVE